MHGGLSMGSTEEERGPVRYQARWFVILGLLALLPAAVLLGASFGEVLRHPSLGIGEILRYEGAVLLLAVIATFLFSTAAGLHDGRRWGLVLGLIEAALIVIGGIAILVGNAALMKLVGAPEVMAAGAIPVALAAILLGTRLIRSLWQASDFALPFGADDLRAFGALGAVAAAGAVGHLLLVSRIAS